MTIEQTKGGTEMKRTQKEVGRELEREVQANGWTQRAAELEAEFWESGSRSLGTVLDEVAR